MQFVFSAILKIWYVEVRISRNVSEGPFNFEITKVDCTSLFTKNTSVIRNGLIMTVREKSHVAYCEIIPSLSEIANFSTKYFILSKVYTNEGGMK